MHSIPQIRICCQLQWPLLKKQEVVRSTRPHPRNLRPLNATASLGGWVFREAKDPGFPRPEMLAQCPNADTRTGFGCQFAEDSGPSCIQPPLEMGRLSTSPYNPLKKPLHNYQCDS